MGIMVELPFPGEWFFTTVDRDFYDKEGTPVRTDKAGTWYEVTETRTKWNGTGFDVICDVKRIGDNEEVLDEPAQETLYVAKHFNV